VLLGGNRWTAFRICEVKCCLALFTLLCSSTWTVSENKYMNITKKNEGKIHKYNISLYLGAVEVKSISRRVSRAMIKGAATAQKAAANLIASTRRVVPFNYMRGGHPRPELPTAHQTPHSATSSRTLRLFLFFFLSLATRENFSILHVAQKKKAFPQQRLRIEASSLLLFVEFSLSRGIFTEKNI